MALCVQTGTGKTRLFDDVIAYLEYTEKYGFQGILADDQGSYVDHGSSSEDPELPEDEWNPSK